MSAPDLTRRSCCYVCKAGTDDPGYNAVGQPQSRITIAAALADLAANYPTASALAPHIVTLAPGNYSTPAFALPPFTFIVGDPDGPCDPTVATIITLTGNVTLASGWSVNQTAFGGFINVKLNQFSSQNVDLTMPVPASGNPARTVILRNVSTNCDSFSWEATSTADILSVFGFVHEGNNGDALEFSGGNQILNNVQCAATMTLNDASAIGAVIQAYGIFITNTLSGLTCNSTIAAGCTVRLGACDLRNLTLAESAPGVIAVSADAISIPLAANVFYTGSATSADLTPTTDGGGVTPINASRIRTGDGTVALPAWSFIADTDLGVYRIGANILGFSTNGTLAFFADASQNLSIVGSIIAAAKLTLAGATGANLKGTTTNDNAAAGDVGEYVSNTVTFNSIPLTNATEANITSISLSAGDWDIFGSVNITNTGVTTALLGGSSLVSATLSTPDTYFALPVTLAAGFTTAQTIPSRRISLAAPAMIYLVAEALFSTGACGGGGILAARRRR